jgi:hypothetical protein
MLKLADLRADRGLCAVTRLRGLRKALQADDFQKCMELIEIHRYADCISRFYQKDGKLRF